MASIYGNSIRISIFGQSHSEAVGVVIDGLPPGESIDTERLQAFLERRAPGRNEYSTQRREPDVPEFLSGLIGGATCGAPVCAVIRNMDVLGPGADTAGGSNGDGLDKTGKGGNRGDIMRPGHADYTARVRYGGHNDTRSGGHLSGRLTAPLCVAGGLCLQILERAGIEIAAHIQDIGGIPDTAFDPVNVCATTLRKVRTAGYPVISEKSGEKMREAIEAARQDGDSLGGVIECAAIGVPAGLGDPMFDGVENRIASIVFGVPAVRGIEFGNGFAAAQLRGSSNNDAFYMDGGAVRTRTNNHGGILGGMTSGMPIIFRVAIKPTPSIAREQESVRIPAAQGRQPVGGGEGASLSVRGRNDPCIVPRAVPCIEAAAAIALLDMMAETK